MSQDSEGATKCCVFNVLNPRGPRLTQTCPQLSTHPNLSRGFTRLSEPENTDRLKELDAKIAQAKAAQAPKPPAEEHYTQAQAGWRMVTELVAGLGIGFGIGYGLDVLFGTLPIMMVLFTFLGFAAGVKTMMRTAEEIQRNKSADTAADEEKG